MDFLIEQHGRRYMVIRISERFNPSISASELVAYRHRQLFDSQEAALAFCEQTFAKAKTKNKSKMSKVKPRVAVVQWSPL